MSMNVLRDQNTAPVLEFRCLYTADTRRKQKRWQDGRLKYHTFNKRVMVFDERANLVGDAHWREKASLDEGAELELERSGILVEVSEFVERRDQDLTELIDKRVKEKEERFVARNGDSSPPRSTSTVIRSQCIAAAHLKPKPLNSILGTPSGHYGKALVPNTSPFEQRQMLNANNADESESPRPAKRRRGNEPPPSKSGFAQNLMGATLSFTPTPSSTGPIRYESLKLKSVQRSENNDNRRHGEDNQEDLSGRKQSLDTDMVGATKSSRARIQSQKRNKPEKSGFASNLTGASLSLSSFREGTPRNTERNSNVQRNQSKTIDLSMDTSSDEDKRSSPILITKEVDQRKMKSQIGSSEQISRSSSPLAKVTAISEPTVKLSRKDQESQNHTSPVESLQGKTHSSLRIKSRPRKKMLMLMDQPSSRPSPSVADQRVDKSVKLCPIIPSTKSSFSSRSSPLAVEQESAKPTKLDPVLPLAKISSPNRLSVSGDERNHAGDGPKKSDDINVNEPQISEYPGQLNCSDSEKSALSPANLGINHQVIDVILSRARSPKAQKTMHNFAIALTRQACSEDQQRSRLMGIEESSRQSGFDGQLSLNEKAPRIAKICGKDHDSIIQTSAKHLPKVPVNERQITESIGPNRDFNWGCTPVSNKAIRKQSETAVQSLVEKDEAMMGSTSKKADTPNTESIIRSEPPGNTSSTVRAFASASGACQETSVVPNVTRHSNPPGEKFSDILALSSDTIAPKAAIKNGEDAVSVLVASLNNIESDKLLLGITSNGSTLNATTRVMAKLTPKSNQHHIEAANIKARSSLIDRPAALLTTAQSLNHVEFKQSPSSLPGIMPIEQTSDETSGFMSANRIAEKEAQNHTSEASTSGDQGLSRPRIINPATRGLSIQRTAKRTLHALGPAVHMGPPAQIFGGLGGRRSTENISARSAGDSGNESGTKGPWSRESFDLFGSWRPPIQQS